MKRPIHFARIDFARIDFAPKHQQPSTARVLLAAAVAVAGSLVADALLVALGEAVFPGTRGYEHFQFGDYAKLTIIGVLIASLGWPVITRISYSPRWLYAWLAVAVTLVLLLPDVWLLRQGQPGRAVVVLIVMHLAIAVVTYCAVVLIARPQPGTLS